MPNPKRKLARSWKGNRRSHDHIQVPSLSTCQRCGQPKLPHRVCGNCGYYNKVAVIDLKKTK